MLAARTSRSSGNGVLCWHGWFHSGLLNLNFDTSRVFDSLFFDELSVCSFESTPDWIPRDDPASHSIHLGGGYLPTWAADWMQRLDEEGLTSIDWDSQADSAGTGTRYDLVDGLVSALRADHDFSGAECLIAESGEPPLTDPGSVPPAGEGRYVLTRARNGCGAGDYGSSTLPEDPRRGLTDGAASAPDPDPCP